MAEQAAEPSLHETRQLLRTGPQTHSLYAAVILNHSEDETGAAYTFEHWMNRVARRNIVAFVQA